MSFKCIDCGAPAARQGRRCQSCDYAKRRRDREAKSGRNPSGICQCGCGLPAPLASCSTVDGDAQGKARRFIYGHFRRTRPLVDRLWEKIAVGEPDDCWEWQADARAHFGYGLLSVDGHPERTHRLVYELEVSLEPIPDGLLVCHHCDNPPCCNPAHLFLGTHADNAADKESKGRGFRPVGELSGVAKLNTESARAIKELYGTDGWTYKRLGKRFGVGESTVRAVVDGTTWKAA